MRLNHPARNAAKALVVIASYDLSCPACGAGQTYFGRDEWEPYAPGLKSLEQATEMRRGIFAAFELV
jgi:NADH dehydrogenase FAD-containing subunit